MKRYLIAILLILSFSNTCNSEEITPVDSSEQKSTIENSSSSKTGKKRIEEDTKPEIRVLEDDGEKRDTVFKSSLTEEMMTELNPTEYNDYDFSYMSGGMGRTYKPIDPDNMPVFKQFRLMLTNKYIEFENGLNKPKTKNKSDKKYFWNKKNADDELENEIDSELMDSIEAETSSGLSDSTVSLEGGINEEVTEKQLILDSDNVDFDEETGDMVASGRPILIIPPQNTKIVADKMVYNEDSNVLKGLGNVVVYKDGVPTVGDYLEVDMNEETMIMNNIKSSMGAMDMNAKKAIQQEGLLIFHDGMFHSDKSEVHRLMSKMIGPQIQNLVVSEDAKSLLFGNPKGNQITLDIKDLKVIAKKNHDVIKAEEIKVYHKDRYLFTWPHLTAYTNKDRDYFEANYPEFGSKRRIGMFIGPGFVFGGPAGSVIKVIPFLNYKKEFGIGGAIKYRNTYNYTELAYGSAEDIFVMRGRQRLDDHLHLQYAANNYVDEWFLGGRMPKYMAEIYYDNKYRVPDFLAKEKDLTFRHRFGFGLMEDADRNFNGEHINSSGMSTTRTRYMAEIRQSIYNYTNEEERIMFNFGVSLQGAASLYGTGDTQFLARFGPNVHMQYKNWMQDIGYFLSGYTGESPMPRFDMYRYGAQSVYISEVLRLNKYVSVGWSGYITLSDDTPNGKMFQENRFLVALGPDDFKISLGYDFIRQRTYFGFNIAFDTKGTTVKYDRLEIKNPEYLGRKDKESQERKLAFMNPQNVEEEENNSLIKFPSKASKNDKKVLKHAEVIEIEDPDRERID